MEETNPTPEIADKLIENLQQTNRLVRSRVIVLMFFLILMIGFSVSIEYDKAERKNIDECYDQLVRILKPDSMKKILTRDSIHYLSRTNLGAYMSFEVLYDRLARDSFQNPEPLYEAINNLDNRLQEKIRDEKQSKVSIAGFSTPIRPIMILAPILLLLLYHDFSVIMLYRRELERKLIEHKVPSWRGGPETVGLFTLDFVPHKLRYIKWLWGIIQMAILFVPVIPAIYFGIYSANELDAPGMVIVVNMYCCVVILLDFLAVVDSEDVLGIRNITSLFSVKTNDDLSQQHLRRKKSLALFLPIFIGLFTAFSFGQLISDDYLGLTACVASSLFMSILFFVFSFLSASTRVNRGKILISSIAGGALFASLYWFVIDLLGSVGAIHFRHLTPWNYMWNSVGVFIIFFLFKLVYLNSYSTTPKREEEPTKSTS